MDKVMNFTALVILLELDNMVYGHFKIFFFNTADLEIDDKHKEDWEEWYNK